MKHWARVLMRFKSLHPVLLSVRRPSSLLLCLGSSNKLALGWHESAWIAWGRVEESSDARKQSQTDTGALQTAKIYGPSKQRQHADHLLEPKQGRTCGVMNDTYIQTPLLSLIALQSKAFLYVNCLCSWAFTDLCVLSYWAHMLPASIVWNWFRAQVCYILVRSHGNEFNLFVLYLLLHP